MQQPSTRNNRSNKRLLRFYSGLVFYVFFKFSSTFFTLKKKTMSNAKYEYAKTQRKILLEDALAMIFIDFGLLCQNILFTC